MSDLKWEEYEALFKPLSEEMIEMARWVAETGKRLLIIFEGRDTAGKGGAISMISRTLNPRQCHVVALPAPSEREQQQWYFQRYVPHLPAKGEIALFDRSWYNRAGVERVMGYCTEEQAEQFLDAVPGFEKQLVDDGILIFKYWLCVDQVKQEKRFEKRRKNPLKRWKLSPIDLKSRTKYDAYTDAREAMLARTNTDFAPWTLVDFNSQERGRLTLLRDLLDRLPDTKLPYPELEWPELSGPPSEERYGVIQPLAPYYGPDEKKDEGAKHGDKKKHG